MVRTEALFISTWGLQVYASLAESVCLSASWGIRFTVDVLRVGTHEQMQTRQRPWHTWVALDSLEDLIAADVPLHIL